MLLAGKVKRAELVHVDQYNSSMLVVTVEMNGKEFLFPMEAEFISSVQLGQNLKLDVAIVPVDKKLTQKTGPLSEIKESTLDTAPLSNGDLSQNNDSLSLDEAVSELDLHRLYGVTKEDPAEEVMIPKIETRLEEIAIEEMSLEGEANTEDSIAETVRSTEISSTKEDSREDSSKVKPNKEETAEKSLTAAEKDTTENEKETDEQAQAMTIESFGNFMKSGVLPTVEQVEDVDDDEEDDDE